jgi:hypothetical protein
VVGTSTLATGGSTLMLSGSSVVNAASSARRDSSRARAASRCSSSATSRACTPRSPLTTRTAHHATGYSVSDLARNALDVEHNTRYLLLMPELSRFFGIVIRMFVEIGGPHHRAHFHAYHQDHVAIFGIDPVT